MKAAEKATAAQRREERLCQLAWRACDDAASRFSDGIGLSPDDFKPQVRLAAKALLHAALSHWFSRRPQETPKTMQWAGRRWHLADIGRGQLQVSHSAGVSGVVSPVNALQE